VTIRRRFFPTKAAYRIQAVLKITSSLPFRYASLSNAYAFVAGAIISIAATLFVTPLLDRTTPMTVSLWRWASVCFLVSALALAAISLELEKYKEDLAEKGNPREVDLKVDILKGNKRLWRLWTWASLSVISFGYGYFVLAQGRLWPL
jgi:hypothetical protein